VKSGNQCNDPSILEIIVEKLEGKVRLLSVTVSFLACLPALQVCSAHQWAKEYLQ